MERLPFGDKIRQLRTSVKLSQNDVATLAGISTAHLGQIERGVKRPNIDTMEKIAAALNISPAILFCSEEPVTPSPILKKIDTLLTSMTEDEQIAVLKIIQVVRQIMTKSK